MKKKNTIQIYHILFLIVQIALFNSCSKDEAIPEDEKFIAISAHGTHSLALKGDSTLWAWGTNSKGELGDGTLENRNKPVLIGKAFIAIAAGGQFNQSFSFIHNTSYSLALKSDGTLWAWGCNESGQLGDNTTEDKTSPVQIGCCYTAIAAGYDHSFGIKTDGTLWAWGSNYEGKLGTGGLENIRQSPEQIGTDFMAVAAGFKHSLGLKTDGTLWAWGFNQFGELGDGTNVNKNIPVQIGVGYSTISAGDRSFAIKTDGTMWAWGQNPHSELGTGDYVNRKSPVQIGSLFVDSRFTSISTGEFHTLAIKADKTLWAWGLNFWGELGTGNNESKVIPFMIASDFAEISVGRGYSVAIKTDGSLWAWGFNYYGQLGDGTSKNRATPVQIGGH